MDVASIVVNVNKGKHARIQRVVVGALGRQNHKTVGLFRKTDMDPQQNHKTTKPAFNVGLHYINASGCTE